MFVDHSRDDNCTREPDGLQFRRTADVYREMLRFVNRLSKQKWEYGHRTTTHVELYLPHTRLAQLTAGIR